MAAPLTRKDIEDIALLARLHLEEDELASMQAELGAILGHMDVLATVDTTGVAPMVHAVPLELRLRIDDVEPSLPVADALRGAPRRDGDLFVVPAVLPGADGEG